LPFTRISKPDINSKADIVHVEHSKDAGTVEDGPLHNASGNLYVDGEQTTRTFRNMSVSGGRSFIYEVLVPGIKAAEDTHNKYTALRDPNPKRLEDKALYGPVSVFRCNIPRSIRQRHFNFQSNDIEFEEDTQWFCRHNKA
jgi:hypothetical protein